MPQMILWNKELDFLKQGAMRFCGDWLDKKMWICSSFSLAGWGPEQVTYRSLLNSSGSAACRRASMHHSYTSNSLSELLIISIGINCHIINTPERTDCSQDYSSVVEDCCLILHGLERLDFKTMFNRVYNDNNNEKEVITVLESHRSKAF